MAYRDICEGDEGGTLGRKRGRDGEGGADEREKESQRARVVSVVLAMVDVE